MYLLKHRIDFFSYSVLCMAKTYTIYFMEHFLTVGQTIAGFPDRPTSVPQIRKIAFIKLVWNVHTQRLFLWTFSLKYLLSNNNNNININNNIKNKNNNNNSSSSSSNNNKNNNNNNNDRQQQGQQQQQRRRERRQREQQEQHWIACLPHVRSRRSQWRSHQLQNGCRQNCNL